jgi:pilus assembly protein Flp/PilA
MKKLIKRFLTKKDGVTAIEYGLLAALIAVVIIVGAGRVGTSLNTIFGTVDSALGGGGSCGGGG